MVPLHGCIHIHLYTRGHQRQSGCVFVWDAQTGVAILTIDALYPHNVCFHGDQRTITVVMQNQHFKTYNTCNGGLLCWGQIPLLQSSGFNAQWAYGDTLQFAVTDGESAVNIYELQPASTPLLCLLSSFPVPILSPAPLQCKGFYFSPASFHASIITEKEIIVFDVQESKLLLRTSIYNQHRRLPRVQFSPDGYFLVYWMYDHVSIWCNTPSGYNNWSVPGSFCQRFSFSPTSTSILCWDDRQMQLLRLGNCLTPLTPNGTGPYHLPGENFRGHSTDETQIVTGQQDSGSVTALNYPPDTPNQFNTDTQTLDVKIADNVTFVSKVLGLNSWHQEMGMGRRIPPGLPVGEADDTLAINVDKEQLTFSHNPSQIIIATMSEVFLYDVKTQKTIPEDMDKWAMPTWSDQHELWSIKVDHDWHYVTLVGPVRLENKGLNIKELLLGLSPHEYYVRYHSEWVMDTRGRRLLWLPVADRKWGCYRVYNVKWDSNFLATSGLIIEFQE